LSHPPPENHQPGEVVGEKKENGNTHPLSLPCVLPSIQQQQQQQQQQPKERKTIHNYISLFFFSFFSVVEGKKETKCQGCYIYIYIYIFRPDALSVCSRSRSSLPPIFSPLPKRKKNKTNNTTRINRIT
jgi:hypothetical protein